MYGLRLSDLNKETTLLYFFTFNKVSNILYTLRIVPSRILIKPRFVLLLITQPSTHFPEMAAID